MPESIHDIIDIIAKRDGWTISELERRFCWIGGFSSSALRRRYAEGAIEGIRTSRRGDITLFSASIITYLRRENDLPAA